MIITVISSKGGAGKTTLTANTGALLADYGYRVLLVDADIQPSLSSYFPVAETAGKGLIHLITQGSAEDCISRTGIDGLDLIYSDDPDGTLSTFILKTADGRARLKFALAEVAGQYDFILVDTQGAVGPLQETAILAADLLVSPLPPDAVSAREFRRGTLRILQELAPMERLGLPVAPLCTVIYRQDRTVDAREIASETAKVAAASQTRLFNTAIPHRVVFRESATRRLPVHRLDPVRKGASPCAREIMEAFVSELWEMAAWAAAAVPPKPDRSRLAAGGDES